MVKEIMFGGLLSLLYQLRSLSLKDATLPRFKKKKKDYRLLNVINTIFMLTPEANQQSTDTFGEIMASLGISLKRDLVQFFVCCKSIAPSYYVLQPSMKQKRCSSADMLEERKQNERLRLCHILFCSAFPSSMLAYPSGIVEPDRPTFLIMLMCYKACLFFYSLICSWGIRRYRA